MALTVGLVAGCGATSASPRPGAATPGATAGQAADTESGPYLIAHVIGSGIQAYRRPGADPWVRLSNPNPDGAPRVFLVIGRQPGWLNVLLPIRPNGSQGWIKASEVRLTSTTYRIDVMLAAHRFTLREGAKTVLSGPIAVGTEGNPTPPGRYFITELLRPPNPNGDYGPYAFGLSGFSPTLKSFGGGAGEMGLHGTNQPQFLGKDVSHGCIRVSNEHVTRLAKLLPLGTPVFVHA